MACNLFHSAQFSGESSGAERASIVRVLRSLRIPPVPRGHPSPCLAPPARVRIGEGEPQVPKGRGRRWESSSPFTAAWPLPGDRGEPGCRGRSQRLPPAGHPDPARFPGALCAGASSRLVAAASLGHSRRRSCEATVTGPAGQATRGGRPWSYGHVPGAWGPDRRSGHHRASGPEAAGRFRKSALQGAEVLLNRGARTVSWGRPRARSAPARSDPTASARPSSGTRPGRVDSLGEPLPPRLRLLGALPGQQSLPEAGRARRLVGPGLRAGLGGACPGLVAGSPRTEPPDPVGAGAAAPRSPPPRRCVSSLLLATVTSGSQCRSRSPRAPEPGSGRRGGSSGGGAAMVLLHVKRGDESQFLLRAPGAAGLGALTEQAARVYNARLKVQRVCSGAACGGAGAGGLRVSRPGWGAAGPPEPPGGEGRAQAGPRRPAEGRWDGASAGL